MNRASERFLVFFLLVGVLLSPLFSSTQRAKSAPKIDGITERVSVSTAGEQGNDLSSGSSISADGRFVAYASRASNLVDGDTNGAEDIFVHDRQTGETTRVSVTSSGVQGDGDSFSPSISADGRLVAFASWSSNLVDGDTNVDFDVFVHDRQTGETTRVSVASNGSQGNHSSGSPAISADGRFVAFESMAGNLVSEDTNDMQDIFVHDRQTGETTRVSVAGDGTQGDAGSERASISANGRFVAFNSQAGNLVSDDTNRVNDVFVLDRQTGETTRISVASDGSQGNSQSYRSSISADGRFVAFYSTASNLVDGDTNICEYENCSDVFVHDLQTGETTRVSVASDGSQGNSFSIDPSISADGRFVAFTSDANNLVSGDTNVCLLLDPPVGCRDGFVHDRQTGETTRISVANDGSQGDQDSRSSSISADGRFVVFDSFASNLVVGDTNDSWDIFVRDRFSDSFLYLPLTVK